MDGNNSINPNFDEIKRIKDDLKKFPVEDKITRLKKKFKLSHGRGKGKKKK